MILASKCNHAAALLSGKPLIAIWSSMTSDSTMMIEILVLLFRLLRVRLLSPRVLSFLLILLRGAPKIDLPLSKFLLAKSILALLLSISTLLLGGTKIAVLVEAVLEEEKPYPKPVRLEADF